MAKYSIYIDVARCIGCYACIVGCNNWHEDNGDRIRIIDKIEGKYPDVLRWIFPVFCMQCEDAPCINACSEEAILRKNGIVIINTDKCIGCGECIEVCPYKAMQMDLDIGKPVKCDFCFERIEKGLNPFCVDICPTDAIIFGDLDDPESKVSKMIKLKRAIVLLPDHKTSPSVFYTGFEELNKAIAQSR